MRPRIAALVGIALLAVPAVVGAAVQQAKLTASDGAAADEFGRRVAQDGDTMVVGAHVHNAQQGAAYVFVREGVAWTEQAKLTASDGAAFDNFGSAVAVHGDIVVVGAGGDDVGANVDQGSAYVFTRAGSSWTEQAKLTASDGAASDRFGSATLAVHGDTVVVGALNDDVGANVDQGSAYVFERAGSTWTEQAKLTASDGAAGDQFGVDVALHGETVAAGAWFDDVGANVDQGSAYVFRRDGSSWTQEAA